MKTIYKTLKQSISSIDSDSDLKFWEDWHGPGMAMEWPSFIEYNPEAKKTQRPKPSRPQNKEVYRLTKVFWIFRVFSFLYLIPLTCLNKDILNFIYQEVQLLYIFSGRWNCKRWLWSIDNHHGLGWWLVWRWRWRCPSQVTSWITDCRRMSHSSIW